MSLPPTTTNQPPAFTSANECHAWLKTVPLTNAVQAQALLLRQVGLLNRYTLPARERLAILEMLERPVAHAQAEAARKFSGRPLPLAPPEQAAFDSCQALWQAMVAGYLRCLESCRGDKAVLRSKAAEVIVEALKYLGSSQADAYGGGREPGGDFWRLAHELYASAEQLGVADQTIADSKASPRGAYGAIVLFHAASPYELNPRQLGWARRWARRWAGKLKVSAAPPAAERTVPLCVDLASDQPVGYRPGAGKGIRWLDTSELRRSLKKRLTLLDQGRNPAELQLGDDCSQPACGQLLNQVYNRWCKGGTAGQQQQRFGEGPCVLVSGIEAMHYYVSGRKPFRPPSLGGADLLLREREEIATFGRIATRHNHEFGEEHGFQLEEWNVLSDWGEANEAASGLHLVRPLKQASGRIGAGHLVAVRPPNASELMLGCVRWTVIDGEERLHVGIQVYPGRPEAMALRGTGLAAVKEKYCQAFLLPAVPALSEPATAVIPVGWFKADRALEVFTDQSRQIRLTQLVERGIDFDRVAYQ